MMESFAGLGAIVTGASQGIGRAIASRLCILGARVLFVARSAGELTTAAAQAAANAVVLPCDITAKSAPATIKRAALADLESLDILVHCAGEYIERPIAEATPEDLDTLYQSNLRAPYALTLALLPLLKASQGQIAFINSSITRAANLKARGPFAATQHALRAIADALRDEINADGIRVISVYPGTTATPRTERIFAGRGRAYEPERLLQPDDVAEATCHALALPRTAEVVDLHIRPMKTGSVPRAVENWSSGGG